jgi:hypothetical protein
LYGSLLERAVYSTRSIVVAGVGSVPRSALGWVGCHLRVNVVGSVVRSVVRVPCPSVSLAPADTPSLLHSCARHVQRNFLTRRYGFTAQPHTDRPEQSLSHTPHTLSSRVHTLTNRAPALLYSYLLTCNSSISSVQPPPQYSSHALNCARRRAAGFVSLAHGLTG